VYGVKLQGSELGISGIRRLMQEVMEELDVDEIAIEGAVRVTGAGPGRTPRRLRFTRQVPAARQAEDD
jgi:hypothetical protein